MKNIFLLLIILSSLVFSDIDEYRTDVYFGNGILTSPDASKSNTILLRDSIIEKMGFNYFKKNIGKVDSAYNRTIGQLGDLFTRSTAPAVEPLSEYK